MLEPKDCRAVADPVARQLTYTIMWRDRALANAKAGERTSVCRRYMRDGAMRWRKMLAAKIEKPPLSDSRSAG